MRKNEVILTSGEFRHLGKAHQYKVFIQYTEKNLICKFIYFITVWLIEVVAAGENDRIRFTGIKFME